MRAALNNHLHVGQDLIKSILLCLFGNSEHKQKWATFIFIYKGGTMCVCIYVYSLCCSNSLSTCKMRGNYWRKVNTHTITEFQQEAVLRVSSTCVHPNQCRNTRDCFFHVAWGCTSPSLKRSNIPQLHRWFWVQKEAIWECESMPDINKRLCKNNKNWCSKRKEERTTYKGVIRSEKLSQPSYKWQNEYLLPYVLY